MAYKHVDAAGLILPGIHFGLDEDTYHEDDALGSTDIGRLDKSISLYWWHSKLNPMRPRIKDDTKDRITGKAVHAIVLEGRQAFESRYMRRPENEDEATTAEKTATTKKYNKLADEAGKELLDADTYDRCVVAGANIASDDDMVDAFTGGQPEVSIFWQTIDADGFVIRKKVRLDYMKVRGLADLKSIANQYDADFPEACLSHMRRYRYPRQATHYFDGRAQVARLCLEGRVYGQGDISTEWLARVASQRGWTARTAEENPDDCGWQWVFWQKTKAPEVWGWTLRPENDVVDWERKRIATALERYKAAMIMFGPDKQWTNKVKLTEISIEELGAYYGR